MKTLILLTALLGTDVPSKSEVTYVERMSPAFMSALRSDPEAWGPRVVRGQTPTYYDENPSGATLGAPTTQPYVAPGGSGGYDPFMGGTVDPYSSGGTIDPYAGGSTYGVYGPQPYRMGWSAALEGGYLFPESVNGGGGANGDLKIVESHGELRYNTMGPNGWIWGWTPAGDIRNWDGPSSPGLPGAVYGLSSDVQLSSPMMGGFSIQGGFTPRLATDFQKSLNSDDWFFDGRVVMTYQMAPEWMLVGGVQYWDRVQDMWIPTGGVVWRPGDRWEFRMTYPKAQASVFMGNWIGADTWFYASGEYHVEAYNIEINKSAVRDTIQISDYRIMLGLKQEMGLVSAFVEGGILLDRDAIFAGNTGDFSIGDGYLVRSGIRF